MPVIVDLTEQEVYVALTMYAAIKGKPRGSWVATCSLYSVTSREGESLHRAVVEFDTEEGEATANMAGATI